MIEGLQLFFKNFWTGLIFIAPIILGLSVLWTLLIFFPEVTIAGLIFIVFVMFVWTIGAIHNNSIKE